MRFFKHWTRATGSARGKLGQFNVTCCGYSNDSLEDALRVAEQRAQYAAQKLANDQFVQDDYYSSAGLMQEEIVEEFLHEGELTAVISRNRYGSLVLNSPDVFFADIDKENKTSKPVPNPVMTILSLFGVAKPEPAKSTEELLIETINEHCQRDASLGLRLYRTMNGYRILLTSETIPAQQSRSQEMLKTFRSDSLYMTLCRTQQCYRARLTPKPWRCGSTRPPYRFPFDTTDQENGYREWEASYNNVIGGFATCALIGHFGSQQIHPVADNIVQLHDHYVLNGEKPLA